MALVISVFGCEEPQPEPVLNLSFSERFVDPVGDDLALVLSANDNWVAVSEVEWLEVQPQSGEASDSKQDIVITAQENSTGQERIGKVVFRTASLEKTVTLYQKVPSESALRGKGTEASPYIIKTPAHMKEVRERMKQGSTTYICLGADIDMQNVTFYPFNNVSPYNKVIHFDGKGFTISNLTCKEKTYPSIFGIFNGSCCNLNVTDALISTEETSAGIIAASASGPVVLSNVNVSGQVRTEANFVGGLIGVVNDITIDNCAADVSISSLLRYAGGLVGQAKSGKFVVRNSRSSGSVSTNVYVGGLLGFSSKDTAVEIYDSYSTASINGNEVARVEGNLNCVLDGASTVYFTRSEPGEEVHVPAKSKVMTYAAKHLRKPDLTVIYMGNNGGFNTLNTLYNQHRAMIEYAAAGGPEDYIVLGFHSREVMSRLELDQTYWDLFDGPDGFGVNPEAGRPASRFVNLNKELTGENYKELLFRSGASATPSGVSPKDVDYVNRGMMPFSYWYASENVSPGPYGAKAFALLVYDKMVELGYI